LIFSEFRVQMASICRTEGRQANAPLPKVKNMAQWNAQANDVFLSAAEIDSPVARQRFLDQHCGNDAALRAQVESLLAASAKVGSFLNQPAADALPGSRGTASYEPIAERPGTVIGPYKLMEQIGEGGFGLVFVAEQLQPVRRKVALKIIKPGMDSCQVVARFEAERQALAMMDHQNIAKVFDAGTTPTGRPYFVMELVHGVPITEYCDANKLTPRQRLELLVPVCHAIQHAHQKGIIHRDLKPSNILVTMYDDKPVPKVIDFGVAKAIEQRLTERTIYTQFGTLVGTFEYMSPEQAEMNAFGVDTRSDIYSLGVLMYELLTGSTPLERGRLRAAAFDEIRRIIKEEDPQRPSVRLSTSDTLAKVAAARQTEPANLTNLVRGELDWIVMKSLEKDRTRRYETANGLARDLERYLTGDVVSAAPPSAGYRLRKFARRHKAGLAAAAAALCFLVFLGAGAGWIVRDREARRTTLFTEFNLIMHEVEQLQEERKWPEALAAARRAEALLTGGGGDVALERRVQDTLADLKLVQRLEGIRLMQAGQKVAQADAQWPEKAYRAAFRDAGVDFDDLTAEAAAARLRSREPAVVPALAVALDTWATNRVMTKDRAGADALFAMAQRIDPDPWRRQVRDAITHDDANAMNRLAASAELSRQPPEAMCLVGGWLFLFTPNKERGLAVVRQAQQLYPADLWTNLFLGYSLEALGPAHQDEALGYYRAAVALRPDVSWCWFHVGVILHYHQKNFDKAIASYRKAIELEPNHAHAYNHLGHALKSQQKRDEAVACFQKSIALDPKYAQAHHNLGLALHEQKNLDEALASFRSAIAIDPEKSRWSHYAVGNILSEQNKLDEAVASYRKAIEVDSRFTLAYQKLGLALKSQLKLDEAISCFRKAIDLDSNYAPAHTGLGDTLRTQKKLVEAIAAYQASIKVDPRSAWGHYGLGLALLEQNDADAAVASFRKAVELNEKSAGNRWALGRGLARQKKLDEAIASFHKGLELDPKHANCHWGLGFVLLDLDRSDEAELAFRKAVSLNPNHGYAYYGYGVAQENQKKWNEAIASYKKAIDLDPSRLDARMNVSRLLADQGKSSDAIACLRAALDRNPNLTGVHARLAWYLATAADLTSRDPKAALVHARKAVELAPKNSDNWSKLGVALLRSGDFKDAALTLEKAEQMWNGDHQHRFFLAMAYWHLGASDKARQAYDQAALWMDKNQPNNDELRRYRVEAEQLLAP
jgi:tetratricopeptide (TPR) repeat protein/serine/threonine protein kinase